MENDVGVAVSTRPLDDGWYGYDLEHKKPVRWDSSPPSHSISAMQILKSKPTFFLRVCWLCRHTSGTILHRWPAWLKTTLCTSPLQSHTCSTVTFEFTVEGSVARRQLIDVTCTDLLCPGIKLVEELLRDVGCVPRHGYHGADACSTC